MKKKIKTLPPARLDRFRQWIKNRAGNIFAAPYLPIGLTVVFVVTVLTNLAVVLMSQRLSFWRDGHAGVGLDIFGGPVTGGPAALIFWSVVYLIVMVALLSFVNYRWSLVGWFAAEFTHFYFIQQTMSDCYMSRWSVSLGSLCQAVESDAFWMLAAIFVGVLLVFSFQPAELNIANKKIARGVVGLTALAPIVWLLIMLAGVVWSAQKPTYGWIPVEVDVKPGPLQDGEAAWDTDRGRMLMFGGASGYLGNDQWAYKSDTWEWDGHAWIEMTSAEIPPGRIDHAIAYDENRKVMVLFGGLGQAGRLSDTWEWDGRNWTQRFTGSFPTARSGHEMFYDATRRKVVLYGGYDDYGTFYNDAWEWNGSQWQQIELQGESPAASVFALSFDTDQDFGFGLLSGSPGGTWRWEGRRWTRLFPEVEPSNRLSTTLVYDTDQHVFFTFGGITGIETLSDTWSFDGEHWLPYTKGGIHPSARSDMTMWFDGIRKHVMLFGGRDGSNIYQDMWEFIPPQE